MGRHRDPLGAGVTASPIATDSLRASALTPTYGASAWLARRASLHPAREAVLDGERRVTYGQLDDRVTRLAAALRDGYGIGRGDRVATLTLNTLEFIEVFYAVARIGGILVPLNWRLAPAELDYQLRDASARLLFFSADLRDLRERLAPDLPLETAIELGPVYEALLSDVVTVFVPAEAQAAFGDPHLIVYTSGTTGHPKGAVLTHANMFWNAVNMAPPVALTERDTTATLLPLFHCGGIGLWTIPTLYVGGRVALVRSFEPDALLALIALEQVALCFGVPAIWLELLKRPDFTAARYPSLRYVVSGGAPHPLALMEAVAERGFIFLQGYGLTETAPGGTLMPVDHWRRKLGTVGRAVQHVELRVVDADGQDAAPGEIGEVHFRGPNVFAGYWNRPDATAEAFTADGWFKSGDLGALDAEGFLSLHDRKKDMVISGGENVYSAEIEDVLFAHPAVAEAAVIGIPDEHWGEAVLAVVAVRAGATLSADEVIAHCREQLAKYKCPKVVRFIDVLPRNASGKVLKRELRQRFGGDAG